MRRCISCIYLGDSNYSNFVCRRYPPAISEDEKVKYPNVYPDDWCGEYKEMDEKEKD